MESINTSQHREPWNKGKLVDQKAPFKLKEIWAIRTRLQMASRSRDLALFDLGIDSKLWGCDPRLPSHGHPAVRTSAGGMGEGHRPRCLSLRDTFHAAHQGLP